MTRTERRYARLVRLYPARCPREEILDTVLQGNGTFSFREAIALLTGALRARTGADVPRTPAGFAWSATRLAALALLVHAAAVDLLTALPLDVPAIAATAGGILQYATAGLLALILHLTAIVSLTRGAHRLAAATTGLGLFASVVGQMRFGLAWFHDGFWSAPLAALLVTALAFAAHRERSSPLWWLLAVIPAVVLLPTGSGTVLDPALFIDQQALLVLTGAALIWSSLDPRVPLAMAALGLSNALTGLSATLLDYGAVPASMVALQVAIATVPVLALVAAAAYRRRRSPI
ncbi:hypothetical protein QLQ12_28940 [Actinoplanes sp. NEAU-A12]|uniref:Uncharacterized protein n=1 Tax=Actinoplanes sandaracinus TaxID=3045177 RepID=A0ABT6WSE2_9ACTN|nr:hypothetical protein [Actinoplanes sandaracinus]MDI6102652.1 hypothetical protein [Actinoplanes sandaracinus]